MILPHKPMLEDLKINRPTRDKADLKNALVSIFGKVKDVSGNQFRIPCPTCLPKDRNKMKRYVSTEYSTSNCFICEQKIKIADLLLGKDLPMAVLREEEVKSTQLHAMARVLPFSKAIPINQLEDSHPAKQFLLKDHLHDFERYWNDYKIVFVPFEHGLTIPFSSGARLFSGDSIVFPTFFDDELVGWQLRYIPGTFNGDKMGKLKYLHLFDKGNYLYNYDVAKTHQNVVCVEGVKKALKLANGVATWGKGISERQQQLLLEWKYITIMLDGDAKTQEKAQELTNQFRLAGRYCVNVNPSEFGAPSPDEMTSDQIINAVNEAWKFYE